MKNLANNMLAPSSYLDEERTTIAETMASGLEKHKISTHVFWQLINNTSGYRQPFNALAFPYRCTYLPSPLDKISLKLHKMEKKI